MRLRSTLSSFPTPPTSGNHSQFGSASPPAENAASRPVFESTMDGVNSDHFRRLDAFFPLQSANEFDRRATLFRPPRIYRPRRCRIPPWQKHLLSRREVREKCSAYSFGRSPNHPGSIDPAFLFPQKLHWNMSKSPFNQISGSRLKVPRRDPTASALVPKITLFQPLSGPPPIVAQV